MKKINSIKTRIVIWYTLLLFILVAIFLSLVGSLSYHMSIENIETGLKTQVYQVSEQIRTKRPKEVLELEKEVGFQNVVVCRKNGEYIAGKYNKHILKIPFIKNELRKEKVSGNEYLIFDIYKPVSSDGKRGYFIRGAESINSATVMGRSVLWVIIWVTPVILLLATIGGYFITKKAFKPINEIAQTAKAINLQSDLKKRIPVKENSREDEIKKLSVTLNEMLDRIEIVVNQEKRFTSDASHELRTPVSVILAQGEYLLDIAQNEKEKEIAQSIVLKANQLSRLISKLLLLARIDNNGQTLNREKVDLGVLAEYAAAEMENSAKQKNIKISLNVDSDVYVNADEQLLLTAIKNLVGNSIKYGKKSGKILIAVSEEGESARIKVADDGIGISKENIEKIWGRFYRSDDVRNDNESYGLGLALTKSIIQLHKGSVSAESQIGKGTCITIVIPK